MPQPVRGETRRSPPISFAVRLQPDAIRLPQLLQQLLQQCFDHTSQQGDPKVASERAHAGCLVATVMSSLCWDSTTFILLRTDTVSPGWKVGTTRDRVYRDLLAFMWSACSISLVRVIVLALADCAATFVKKT